MQSFKRLVLPRVLSVEFLKWKMSSSSPRCRIFKNPRRLVLSPWFFCYNDVSRVVWIFLAQLASCYHRLTKIVLAFLGQSGEISRPLALCLASLIRNEFAGLHLCPFPPSKHKFLLLLYHVTDSSSLWKTHVPPLGDRQLVLSAVSSSISVRTNAFKSSNDPVHVILFFLERREPYKISLILAWEFIFRAKKTTSVLYEYECVCAMYYIYVIIYKK